MDCERKRLRDEKSQVAKATSLAELARFFQGAHGDALVVWGLRLVTMERAQGPPIAWKNKSVHRRRENATSSRSGPAFKDDKLVDSLPGFLFQVVKSQRTILNSHCKAAHPITLGQSYLLPSQFVKALPQIGPLGGICSTTAVGSECWPKGCVARAIKLFSSAVHQKWLLSSNTCDPTAFENSGSGCRVFDLVPPHDFPKSRSPRD